MPQGYSIVRGGKDTSRVVRKTVDETVNNSATLQDDDALTQAVEADTVYEVEALIVYNSSTTADLKLGFTAPAGTTLVWTGNALVSGASGTDADIRRRSRPLAEAEAIGGAGAPDAIALVRGTLVVGGTAGSLTVQWSQLTAEASDTVVRANSTLKLTTIT